jgi:hypothetical protein
MPLAGRGALVVVNEVGADNAMGRKPALGAYGG